MRYVSILMLINISAAAHLAHAMNGFPKITTDEERQKKHNVDRQRETLKFLMTVPTYKDDAEMQEMWNKENASDKELEEFTDKKMSEKNATPGLRAQLQSYLEGEGFWTGPGEMVNKSFWTGQESDTQGR